MLTFQLDLVVATKWLRFCLDMQTSRGKALTSSNLFALSAKRNENVLHQKGLPWDWYYQMILDHEGKWI